MVGFGTIDAGGHCGGRRLELVEAFSADVFVEWTNVRE